MRRKQLLLTAGLIGLAAAGCNRQSVQPNVPGMASNSNFDPTTVPQQAQLPREAPRKANAPLRADTEVALAVNLLEDAFQEQLDQSAARNPTTREQATDLRPKYAKAEQDQMLDTARQRLQRAVASEPNHKGALVALGRLYALTGDRDRAVATYMQAVKAHPQDHGLACKLAGVQIQFGDFPGAEQSARYALSLDPENKTYKKALGLALGHQAKWQEAGEALLASGMAEADAHYFLARVRLDRGDADGGRKQLALVLATNPNHEPARQVAATLDAGRPAPPLGANPVMTAGYAETPPR